MMRAERRARRSAGSRAQSAVMPSVECTARIATTFSYVRSSPITPTVLTGRRTAKACRSEEHTSELQSRFDLVCRLLLEKKKNNQNETSPQDNSKRFA